MISSFQWGIYRNLSKKKNKKNEESIEVCEI